MVAFQRSRLPKIAFRYAVSFTLLVGVVCNQVCFAQEHVTPQNEGPVPREEQSPTKNEQRGPESGQPPKERTGESGTNGAAPDLPAGRNEVRSAANPMVSPDATVPKEQYNAVLERARSAEEKLSVAEAKVRELTERIKEKDSQLDASRKEVAELKAQRDRALEEAERKRADAVAQIEDANKKIATASLKEIEAQKAEVLAKKYLEQGALKEADARAQSSFAARMRQEAQELKAEGEKLKNKGLSMIDQANEAFEQAKRYQAQIEEWMKKPGNAIRNIDGNISATTVRYNGATSTAVGGQVGMTTDAPGYFGRTSINFNYTSGPHGNGVYSNRNTRTAVTTDSVTVIPGSGVTAQATAGIREQGIISTAQGFNLVSTAGCAEVGLNVLRSFNSGRVQTNLMTSVGGGENIVTIASQGYKSQTGRYVVGCGNAELNVGATSANGKHKLQAGAGASSYLRVNKGPDEKAIAYSLNAYLRYTYKTGEKTGVFVSAEAQHDAMDLKAVPSHDTGPGRATMATLNAGFTFDRPFATQPPKAPNVPARQSAQ